MTVSLRAICCITIISICAVASTIAQPKLTFNKLTYPTQGHYALLPLDTYTLAFIDQAGFVSYNKTGGYCNNQQISGDYITAFNDRLGGLLVFDKNMNLLDTYRLVGNYISDFHEGFRRPNGNVVLVGIDQREIDMSGIIDGGSTDAVVVGAVIQELAPDHTLLFEWKSLGSIPITECVNDEYLVGKFVDYIHVNGIAVDENGDYLISCRHLDQIIKVSRTTGEVLWQLGGQNSKSNDFTWKNDVVNGFRGFSHQHNITIMSNGHLLMLDNGNNKPVQESRGVEYKVDQTNMTVEAVWSYTLPNQGFVNAMGSVQELPTGNILMGWGGYGVLPIATEITHSGEVVMECVASNNDVTSYRIYQYPFRMQTDEKLLSQGGRYEFTGKDSSTHVSVNLDLTTQPTKMSVGLHEYAPRPSLYNVAPPCNLLPMRWSIFLQYPNAAAGEMVFDLKNLPMSTLPQYITLYRRAVQGVGRFDVVNATYNAATKSLVVNDIRAGEYALGYTTCLTPTLVSPVDGKNNVPLPAELMWTESLNDNGYEVEVYEGNINGRRLLVLSVQTGTSIKVSSLQDQATYAWRVRALRTSGNSDWSEVWTFKATTLFPKLIEPVLAADTVAIDPLPVFRWTRLSGQQVYRLMVRTIPEQTIVLNMVVNDTTYVPTTKFEYGKFYSWTVSQVGIDIPSENGYFVVEPDAPKLKLPLMGEAAVHRDNAALSWNTVDGFFTYHVHVSLDSGRTVWFEDTIRSLSIKLTQLPYQANVMWSVRTIGQYGASRWSEIRKFRVLGAPSLSSPYLLKPVNNSVVDADEIVFTWSAIPLDAQYWIEVSTNPSFTSIAFDRVGVTGTSTTVKTLLPGVKYYWRVSGYTSEQTGTWSETGYFTTASKAGQALIPIQPVRGAFDVPVQCEFVFSMDSAYTSYDVELCLDTLFTTIIGPFSTPSSPVTVQLPESSLLYWRVKGYKASGRDFGAWSMFTTETISSVEHDAVAGTTPVSCALFTVTGVKIFEKPIYDDSEVAIEPPTVSTGVYLFVIYHSDGTNSTSLKFIE